EICGACHPFFTGQQKFVDTEGRVDRFEKRRKTALKAGEQVKQKKAKKEAEKTREKTRPKTLKEVLEKNSKQS
ncbi:50S ribosomal protein L31, partial [Candidatus Parcubacteria bacterium]|nr:50S ribosomal protein L31 [Candidatus Parcubacteria bacterium]